MNRKQQKLFDSVLACIVYDGWTERALANGAKAAGFSSGQVHKLFPGGISDIVASFHEMINDAMCVAIKGHRKFNSLRVRDKIAFAVRARLVALEKRREAVRRLIGWALLPQNIRAASTHSWRDADAAWLAAGDTSTDYNFYTKRTLLLVVMKATLVFWLNDTSVDCCDSWAFLDRRIADVMKIGKGMSVIKTIGFSDIASFIRVRLAA